MSKQYLHLLRKLNVSNHILTLVYRSIIKSILILIFNPDTSFSAENKTNLSRINNQASKITVPPQAPSHALHHCVRILHTGTSY